MSKKKSCIQSQGLTVEFLEEITMLLKMIAHPHRLKIIEFIERDEEVNVSSIVDEIQIPQSSVSIHLNQMKRMGLLKSSRLGREVRYRIDNPHVFKLLECICKSYHEECND